MSSRTLVSLVLAAACLGFGFAAASTYDFAAHLDRQVHSLHCSFIPGLSGSDAGAQGCQVTLMSPYSSLFRKSVWGGVPISLPAMGTFAAIAALAAAILLSRAETERTALLSLLGLSALPVLASLVMGSIAAFKLHAACKQCIGIYSASLLCGVLAWLAFAARVRIAGGASEGAARRWLMAFPIAGLFVLVPMTSYVLAMPSYARYAQGCGTLTSGDDRHGVVVRLGPEVPGARRVTEVFDPLCPACKAFEERLRASGLHERMTRSVVLFPLDNTCNWMVDSAMHPGACAVSAAVLCAGDHADDVVQWAFAQQDALREATMLDARAAERMTVERFPSLKSCIGAAVTKARLQQSLRWAVRNRLPVLTPQLYVDGKRLCDEDTDLGLEYTLSRMLRGEP